MLVNSRCIEVEGPGYCPPPKLRNIGGVDQGTLRYITNNTTQILPLLLTSGDRLSEYPHGQFDTLPCLLGS